MKEGTASRTARGVAARRLEYDRVAAPYGDPAADEALTSDVADGLTPEHNRMHEYIRARTAFFDRIVVNSIDRGDRAGRDRRGRLRRPGFPLRQAGRPLVRGRPPGHPGGQARPDRPARHRDAAGQLHPRRLHRRPGRRAAAGGGPRSRAPGVVPVRRRRRLPGTAATTSASSPSSARSRRSAASLAISVSVGGAASPARAAFQRRVAAMGEPARTVLTYDQAAEPAWRPPAGRSGTRATGSGPRDCC